MLNFLLGIFAHNLRDGMLLIDEVELHLHARWQSLLLEILQDLADTTNNQVIISTHSGSFLTADSIEDVLRVYRDNEGVSHIARLAERAGESIRDTMHMVNTLNNEKMFFADRVLLVEGIKDRLIMERLIALYEGEMQLDRVTEVLDVGGKARFAKYRTFLEAMGVTVYAMADLDYLEDLGREGLSDLLVDDLEEISRNVLLNKKSRDRMALAASMQHAIEHGDLDELRDLWIYIAGRHLRLKSGLSHAEHKRVDDFFAECRAQGMFILRNGEIENYLPRGQTSLDRVIDLVSDDSMEKWLRDTWDSPETVELLSIARAAVGAGEDIQKKVQNSLAGAGEP